jgi:hypothetical protein
VRLCAPQAKMNIVCSRRKSDCGSRPLKLIVRVLGQWRPRQSAVPVNMRRINPSLRNTILIAQVCFSLPMFLFFLSKAHSRGALTLSQGVRLAFIWAAGGCFLAVAMWFTYFLPLMRSRQASSDGSHSNKRLERP